MYIRAVPTALHDVHFVYVQDYKSVQCRYVPTCVHMCAHACAHMHTHIWYSVLYLSTYRYVCILCFPSFCLGSRAGAEGS